MLKLIKWLCIGIGALVICFFLLGMCDSILEDEEDGGNDNRRERSERNERGHRNDSYDRKDRGNRGADYYASVDFESMNDKQFEHYVYKLDQLSERELDKVFDSFPEDKLAAFIERYEELFGSEEDFDEYEDYEGDDDDEDGYYAYDDDEEGDYYDDEDEEPAPAVKPSNNTKPSSNSSDYEPGQTVPGGSSSNSSYKNDSYTSGSADFKAAMQAYNNNDAEKAIALFEECNTGEALHMIAEIYRNGMGSVKKNAIRAMMYDKKAKEAGYNG
ncbi:MAG: hypothetical protein MJZ31_12815 [Bacteroidales bacterium]|nr:hypothetical protein [Bacteroidales bacterium]